MCIDWALRWRPTALLRLNGHLLVRLTHTMERTFFPAAVLCFTSLSLKISMVAFSIAEAKAQLSAIVSMVENGESITITKRGIPVVKIVPLTAAPVKPKMDLEKLRAFRATLTPMKESAVVMIRRMRDGEIDE